jgi:hypothetical protein
VHVSERIVQSLRTLGAKRASDRPLVVGAKVDPAQYAAQFWETASFSRRRR